MKRRANLIVSGWFGCGNAGDDAIMEGIVRTVRELRDPPEVAVLSYDPEGTEAAFGIRAHPHLPTGFLRCGQSAVNGSLGRTIRAFRWADLFLLGGGGFLSDWQKEAPWLWLRQLLLAKALGKVTMLYGLGIGPFLTDRGKRLTRCIVNRYADYITVRDEKSKQWLLDIGCDVEITVTGDPALSLNPSAAAGGAILKDMGLHDVPLLGINAIPLFYSKEWGVQLNRYTVLTDRLIDIVRNIVLDLDVHVLGIPFMRMDRDLLETIAAEVGGEKVHVMDHRLAPGALLAVIGHLDAMIGMRYHSLLFAAMMATPFYGIVYHHKGAELVRTMKMDKFAQEIGDGTQARDRDLDPETIADRIRHLLSHRDEIGKEIASNMKGLRVREKQNQKILHRAVEGLGAES